MDNRTSSIVLVSALVGIGAFALLRSEHTPPEAARDRPSNEQPVPQVAKAPPIDPNGSGELPPGHPDISGGSGGAGASNGGNGGSGMSSSPGLPPPQATGPGSLTWKAPPSWTVAPNPSSMRLATYHLPRAAGDTEDAEVAITRAGGDMEANIQRWLGQFSEHGKELRSVITVRGIKITIVDISGTFGGSGMVPGEAPSSHPNWTMLVAIIDTDESPYFVKITGPSATVRAARPGFDALLQSLTPSST